jgi:uncharacterized protein (DUF2062 family)
MAHRVRRLPGTPYRIAAGVASGAAVSFTPFIGLHFVAAALLSLLLRGNVVASAIGTAVGNPWTFPFIWTWIYTLGQWLMGADAASDFPATLDLDYIFERPLDVLWPMTLGALPTAVVVWIAIFWPVRGAIAEYQHVRHRRIRRKVRARLAKQEANRLAERLRVAAAASRDKEEA